MYNKTNNTETDISKFSFSVFVNITKVLIATIYICSKTSECNDHCSLWKWLHATYKYSIRILKMNGTDCKYLNTYNVHFPQPPGTRFAVSVQERLSYEGRVMTSQHLSGMTNKETRKSSARTRGSK